MTDEKYVEMNGKNQTDDNVDVRGKDTKKRKVGLLAPFTSMVCALNGNPSLAYEPNVFPGPFGFTETSEMSLEVDINKR